MKSKFWWLIMFGILLLFWLFNVSRPGRQVLACLDGCARFPESVPDRTRLRVVSLNMLHGIPSFEHLETRLDLLVAELQRLDVDMIALQEVPWRLGYKNIAAVLAERLGMNYAYVRANGNRWAIGFEEGEAILSRFTIQDVTFFEVEPQAGLFEHRVVLTAWLRTPFADLPVIATHLTHSDDQANQDQIAALQTYMAELPKPALVMGDFNAWPDTPAMMALEAAWVDSYASANPGQQGFTCCVDTVQADRSTGFRMRIDYIFLVPDAGHTLTVASSRLIFDQPFPTKTGWLWASDHGGLLTEFSLAP